MFKNYFLVFVGGGLGSIARYTIALWLPKIHNQLPWNILLANAAACVLIGVVSSIALSKNTYNQTLVVLLVTGFCGGLSTFSSFSNDNYLLFDAKLYMLMLANIVLNVVVCFVAVALGYMAIKRLL
jgi:fluoride exporter